MTTCVDPFFEERADVARNLLPEVGPLVVHRHQHAGNVERWIERGANTAQCRDEIGQTFEREVLAVERNQDRVGGHERIEREQSERRRRVDEDVVEVRRGAGRAAVRRRCSRWGSETRSISAPVRLRSAGMRESPATLVVRQKR